MQAIGRSGSFAAAARVLGRAPSSVTYAVRQLEERLDVLLFDRGGGSARLTAAGQTLVEEAGRLLADLESVSGRLQRQASGWEARFTLAVDDLIARGPLLDICQDFYALRPGASEAGGTGTRLRLRTEILAGTWEALLQGEADLAVGTGDHALPPEGFQVETLGQIDFAFAVAPRHPLARHRGPIPDSVLVRHRAVAVADSARRFSALTVNLLPGQDVLTVGSIAEKLQAQLRGLGCGFLPAPLLQPYLARGELVTCRVREPARAARLGYAWRVGSGSAAMGKALRWWLGRLRSPATRQALLG
jgi:DNA-binding transcriptional LysR family regulator